jgi:hypothetical protein
VAGEVTGRLASTGGILYIFFHWNHVFHRRTAMIGPETDTVSFVGMNLLLVGGVGLLIFIFFVLLTRKRWKANFLHPQDPGETKEKPKKDGVES